MKNDNHLCFSATVYGEFPCGTAITLELESEHSLILTDLTDDESIGHLKVKIGNSTIEFNMYIEGLEELSKKALMLANQLKLFEENPL